MTRFPSDPIEVYNRYGFAILKVFDEQQVDILDAFARAWIYRLLAKWTAGKDDQLPLETYHIWPSSLKIDHGNVFRAPNRHTSPESEIERILINDRVRGFVRDIGIERYSIWDEGLGWLAFRFIRPGVGDGYPFSRKEWGIAKNVVSCWIPIIGYEPTETLTLVPGSHLKEYERHLPTESKFAKDEYRLANAPSASEVYNPQLKKGEVIFFHPRTLHSEDVIASSVTRLSLEFRLDPVCKEANTQ